MLEIINGAKQYGKIPLLQDVNLKFNDGKMYALVGPSGIGKSTILNALAKLEAFSSGTVRVDGRDLEEITVLKYFRDYLGYLFQNYALIEEDTVRSNLCLAQRYSRAELQVALSKFGLSASYLSQPTMHMLPSKPMKRLMLVNFIMAGVTGLWGNKMSTQTGQTSY